MKIIKWEMYLSHLKAVVMTTKENINNKDLERGMGSLLSLVSHSTEIHLTVPTLSMGSFIAGNTLGQFVNDLGLDENA